MRCDTDGGPEFANAAFRGLLARYGIEHVIKDPNDYQALATLDRAIGVVKRMLQRKHDAKGGTWVDNLPGEIWAYNNTEQGGINAVPGDLTDDNVFSLKMQAAEDLGDNTELLEKRREKLESEGGYRIYEPKGKLKGLRRRIDTHTWSRAIHQVKDFPAPGIVEDTEGEETLTKFAKPVPLDSSRLVEKQAAPPPQNLEPFAKMLAGTLPGQGQSFSKAHKELKTRVGFSTDLTMAKLTFKDFVAKFPQHLRVHDGRIYSVAPAAKPAPPAPAKAAPLF